MPIITIIKNNNMLAYTFSFPVQGIECNHVTSDIII